MKDGKNYYFDSFGFPVSQEVEDQIGEYVYADIDLQHINSTSCGYFCIAFMRWMQQHKNKKSAYSNFLKLFSENTKMNEMILHRLLN